MKQMQWIQRLSIPALCLGMLLPVAAQSQTLAPHYYQKKDTWNETMLASRERYLEWFDWQPVRQGAWHMSNLTNRTITDAEYLQYPANLQAKDERGAPVWNPLPRSKDDYMHPLLLGKGTDYKWDDFIFFVNTLTSDREQTIIARIRCTRDVEVFVNGQKVQDKDRLGGQPGDAVKLPLRQGDNQVLVKAFNTNPKEIDFGFSILDNPAVEVFKYLERDYPLQMSRLEWDLGVGGYLEWFDRRQITSGEQLVERRLIEHALKGIKDTDAGLRAECEALFALPFDAQNPRYLVFYEKLTRIRRMSMELDRVDFRALRMSVEDLSREYPTQYADGSALLRRLGAYESKLPDMLQLLGSGDADALRRVTGYTEEILAFQREATLSNPLLNFDELLLLKRKPLGNPYLYHDASKGPGKYIGLPQQSSWQLHKMDNIFDFENEVVRLTGLRPDGKLSTIYAPDSDRLITEMDLHFDGERAMVSMPDDGGFWQLHEIDVAKGAIRQLTGDAADVHSLDGCYMPNGEIAYISTASFQGVPCNQSVNVGMLYKMDGNGKNIRQIAFEQDHDFCPTVMNDGRLLYMRWEYTDIPHVWARYLFTMNPDGTGQRPYYGTGSYWPNAMFYTRPIPGHPTKVAGIVTGHHVGRAGQLMIFDPAQSRYGTEGVVQEIPGYGKEVKPLIEDRLTNTVYPKFLHPYPLSEKYFLVTCRPTRESMWGIYLVDTFDNMTLIKEVQDYALVEPIPLRKTETPPVIADMTDLSRKDAVVYIENIYAGRGLKGVPEGTVKNLRLFTYHFAYRTVAGIAHRVGADGPWEPKRILGSVPVEEDGSVLFRIPANTPISIQPVDAEGKALQLMRSWTTAMPGEMVSCVGCHEEANSSPLNKLQTQALTKEPEELRPWYGPVRGFSFLREVQPVLDQYCVSCHDAGGAQPDLRADQGKLIVTQNGDPEPLVVHDTPAKELVKKYGGVFPPSYIELRRRVRVGGLESDLRTQNPGEFHADNSELFQMLNKGHHGVQLDPESVERLAAWIDLNAPCHGTWEEVVGEEKIAGDRQRREALRGKYAGLYEDFEVVQNVPVKLNITPKLMHALEGKPAAAPKVDNWPLDAATARKLQQKTGQITKTLTLDPGIEIDMVYIPAGTFVMGDANGHADERPLAPVTVDKPFWMSKTEITNEQFASFDPKHDSRWEHKGSWFFNEWDLGWNLNEPRQPVVRISQLDASGFCQWLAEKLQRPVSLPTEAQWEYACRAGSSLPFGFGASDADFGMYANLADWTLRDLAYDARNNYSPDLAPRDDRFNDAHLVTADAGTYQPNIWGLHDMHGNVWEWTRSKFAVYPYNDKDGRNDGLNASSNLVVRGGSWYDRPDRGRAGYRLQYPAWRKVMNVGFRIVIPVDGDEQLSAR